MAKKSHFKLPPSEMTKEVPRHSLPTESVSIARKNRALSRKTLLTKSHRIFHGDGHSAAGVSPSLPPTPPQFHTHFSISRGCEEPAAGWVFPGKGGFVKGEHFTLAVAHPLCRGQSVMRSGSQEILNVLSVV